MNYTTREVVVRQFSAEEWIGVETSNGVRSIYSPGTIDHVDAAIQYGQVFLGSEATVRGWISGSISLPNATDDILRRANETIALIDVRPGIGTFCIGGPGGSSVAFATDKMSLRESVARHISMGRRVFLCTNQDAPSTTKKRVIVRCLQIPVNKAHPVIAILGLDVSVIQEPGVASVREGQKNIRSLLDKGWRFFALRNVTDLKDSIDISEEVALHYDTYTTSDRIDLENHGLTIHSPTGSLVHVLDHPGGLVSTIENGDARLVFASVIECAEYYIAAGYVVSANTSQGDNRDER